MKWQTVALDVAALIVGAALMVFGAIYGSSACLVAGSSLLGGVFGARAGQKSEAAKNGNSGPTTGAVAGLVVGLPNPFASKR